MELLKQVAKMSFCSDNGNMHCFTYTEFADIHMMYRIQKTLIKGGRKNDSRLDINWLANHFD